MEKPLILVIVHHIERSMIKIEKAVELDNIIAVEEILTLVEKELWTIRHLLEDTPPELSTS